MDSQSDEQLAAAAQTGNVQAFGELVQRYEAAMQRYARRFLFTVTDTDDVVQDIFLKAFQNLQSFDAHRRFSPWLYRIAHNHFLNVIRKRSHEPVPFFDPDTLLPHPVAPDNPQRDQQDAELQHAITTCLDKLSPVLREVVVLALIEDLPHADIADILHVPIGTVDVRLSRAKVKLRHLCHHLAEHL
ncbi:MAG: RNA polymerase sigma factor [bacterium]|nr:RNA polymerase sigma factor [bacterium]